MKNQSKNQSKNTVTRIALLSVLALPLVLGGCHTVEGVGTDIKQAGAALEHSVESNKESCRRCCPCCARYY